MALNARYYSSFVVVGDLIFILGYDTKNEENGYPKCKGKSLVTVLNSIHLKYLKYFSNIRIKQNPHNDLSLKSSTFRISPERWVDSIKGNISQDILEYIQQLKLEADVRLPNQFGGDMAMAKEWIDMEFEKHLISNPSLIMAEKKYVSVFAALPMANVKVLPADCVDYHEIIEDAVKEYDKADALFRLIGRLGSKSTSFASIASKRFDRHHFVLSLWDSRDDSLLNIPLGGTHKRLHDVVKSVGIEQPDPERVAMNIGQCDDAGVQILYDNIEVFFGTEFRSHIKAAHPDIISNPNDPRETFILHLNGGDLFRENLFDILEKYGYSVEPY